MVLVVWNTRPPRDNPRRSLCVYLRFRLGGLGRTRLGMPIGCFGNIRNCMSMGRAVGFLKASGNTGRGASTAIAAFSLSLLVGFLCLKKPNCTLGDCGLSSRCLRGLAL